jgi:preprotein translocase subunit SecB
MPTQPPGTIQLVAHYLRDFSFEHPNAPYTLRDAHSAVPTADVQVTYRQLEADVFEVSLTITASAKAGDALVAVVECSYAGTYRVPLMEAEMREAFLMVDAPRDLFPFARAAIGLVTQLAGIPPLLLQGPDFSESYRMSRQQKIEQGLRETSETKA